MDSAGSDRPQRRTALVGRGLGRYGIEKAALSETRFAEIGEIKEVGAGYLKVQCQTMPLWRQFPACSISVFTVCLGAFVQNMMSAP